MPIAWIEKLQNEKAKKWAFDYLSKGDVLWAADRGEQYPCVVAEVSLENIETFSHFVASNCNPPFEKKNSNKN